MIIYHKRTLEAVSLQPVQPLVRLKYAPKFEKKFRIGFQIKPKPSVAAIVRWLKISCVKADKEKITNPDSRIQ